MQFNNRLEAGQELVNRLDLTQYDPEELEIVAIPNAGIMVALPIAEKLELPLKVLIANRILISGHEDLPLGAISVDHQQIINENHVSKIPMSEKEFDAKVNQKFDIITTKEAKFRKYLLPADLSGKTIILVQDYIRTGLRTKIALKVLENRNAQKIVCATPIAAKDVLEDLRLEYKDHPLDMHILRPQFRDKSDFKLGNIYKNWHEENIEHVLQELDIYYRKMPF